MKRHSNEQPLKAVIEEFLKTFRLDEPMAKQKVVHQWSVLMGPAIARKTRELYFSGRTLIVHLDSSVLRQELSFGREKLIASLNEAAGMQVVEEIIFR